jgi:hypothetical protein
MSQRNIRYAYNASEEENEMQHWTIIKKRRNTRPDTDKVIVFIHMFTIYNTKLDLSYISVSLSLILHRRLVLMKCYI